MIIPVILSGGSGTRLWPLSRKLYPKQLLNLTGKGSLLQATVRRGSGLNGSENPEALLLVMPSDHVFKDRAAFNAAFENGVTSAQNGDFVLFGEKR